MQRPNTTAIKTTANILLLLENADKISGVDMLVLFVSNIEENQIQEMMRLESS